MSNQEGYIVYVDTGGTFSDAVVVSPDGTYISGKALTTPDNLEECFFNCIEAAARNMGSSLEELLVGCAEIGYGTTAGTNMVVTGAAGPKLGLITTKGIEDRTLVWRHRPAGLAKEDAMHMISSGHPRHIIPKRMIKGVTERVDSMGEIVVPLREEEVRQAVEYLLDKGVEGIVVGYLWSFLNNAHEVRTREIIKEMAPELMVTISSEVCPTIREYPRFMSAIIDLSIGKALRELLERMENRLNGYGYKKPLLVMQAIGGVTQSKTVKPGTTLHSGPVGGLAGVEFWKKIYGYPNAMGSDVGGTSFDVTISPEIGEEFLREPVVGRYEIASPMREIITIGAGGGTIAWIDPVTKTLRLGPHSAGSTPGPVCYERGGVEPTVTDADVVMNRISADYFLGGQKKLNREKALAVIKEKIAEPMGMDVIEAAEGISKVIDGMMQATLKTTLASKGINPQDYVLFAFGGAGPTHCAGYSAGLGFKKVIITPYAAVFSAFGAATSDIRHRYEASPYLLMPNLPYDVTINRFDLNKLTSLEQIPSWVPERYNHMFAELEERAYQEIELEGYRKDQVSIAHEFLGRYGGQLWEIRVNSPVSRIDSVEDLKKLMKAFEEEYLKVYTREAMVPRGGLEIISLALVVTAPTIKPKAVKHEYVGEDPSGALREQRDVYFDGQWRKTNVYDMHQLQVGNRVEGVAIIEARDTTLVVPQGRKVTVDEYLNMIMEEM